MPLVKTHGTGHPLLPLVALSLSLSSFSLLPEPFFVVFVLHGDADEENGRRAKLPRSLAACAQCGRTGVRFEKVVCTLAHVPVAVEVEYLSTLFLLIHLCFSFSLTHHTKQQTERLLVFPQRSLSGRLIFPVFLRACSAPFSPCLSMILSERLHNYYIGRNE